MTQAGIDFLKQKYGDTNEFIVAEDDVAYFEQLLVEAEASGNADEIARAQKRVDLMRDAITIYRLTRAPDQRIFMVDAGTIPTNQLQEAMELVKSGLKN
jgi:hypothetical protein